ncbi:hypothetical protein ACHWGL_29665, partial [Klebsiella pneumoniae]|uniref:hypothetical protein n=1 Tax=Klebsiella pneumoniae TaxID=573 RepID=UPI00376ECE3D
MLYDLVVMFEFGGHKVGDRITDANEIALILASPSAGLTRRVYHAEGTAAVPPPASVLPDGIAVSVVIGGVAYPFTLAQLRIYLGGTLPADTTPP